MKYSNLPRSILVTRNLTCFLNLMVMSCCVLSQLSLCEATTSVSCPPCVFCSESEDPRTFAPIATVLCCCFIWPWFNLRVQNLPSPTPPITNAFKEHNLGIWFHLKNCIYSISFGVKTSEVDRDQIVTVVESRLHFVSFTFQIYLKWYAKKSKSFIGTILLFWQKPWQQSSFGTLIYLIGL